VASTPEEQEEQSARGGHAREGHHPEAGHDVAQAERVHQRRHEDTVAPRGHREHGRPLRHGDVDVRVEAGELEAPVGDVRVALALLLECDRGRRDRHGQAYEQQRPRA